MAYGHLGSGRMTAPGSVGVHQRAAAARSISRSWRREASVGIRLGVTASDAKEKPAPVPSVHHNCGSWIDGWAQRRPAAPAILFGDVELSYARLAERVAKLDAVMRGRGVAIGERVAILLENHPAYIEVVFAAARAGAIALPINTRLAPAELAFILEDAAPRLIVCSPELREKLGQACRALEIAAPEILQLGGDHDGYEIAIAAADPAPEARPLSPDDPMILMYTSGTTGHPKGALLPHRKALFNSLNAQASFEIRPSDRALVVAPLFHSLGLQILSLPLIYSGACVVLQSGFDAARVIACLERDGIHFMGGVPTYYERIRTQLGPNREKTIDASSLRFLFTAGAAASRELIEDFAQRGLVLRQGYGQTETSMLCCVEAPDVLRKAGSVGRPLEHTVLRVIEPDSLASPSSEWRDTSPTGIGEIVVHGPTTMLGYWNCPQETAITLRDGWVLTGDLARLDDEGFVTLEGRSREMYITGGENVYPAEVEATFARHPAVREIAVVGRPDPSWGEVGEAWIVLRAGHSLDPEALGEWAREQIAAYKIPRHFCSIESLPRTASGKIQKHRLG